MSRTNFKHGAVTPNPPANPQGHLESSLKSRMQSWYASKGPVIGFVLKFGVFMALYYVISLVPFFDRLLYAYLSATASFSSAILNLFGQDTHASEIAIRSAHYDINVRRGCDAVEPAWFFCAAVLSFPSSLLQKLPGIAAGVILILCLNLIRIVSLYFIGLHYPKFFNPVHLEIWPMVFILTALVLWAGWIKWIMRKAKLHVAT
jgi:exosortase family protein XrtM